VTQSIQGGNDLGLVVGHHADLFQVDSQRRQEPGDMAGVGVLGAARQDFVTNDQDGRSFCHL
jgi:hypothetical protein